MRRVFKIYYNNKKTKRLESIKTLRCKPMTLNAFKKLIEKEILKAEKLDKGKSLITWSCNHSLKESLENAHDQTK